MSRVYPLLFAAPSDYYSRLIRENDYVLEVCDNYSRRTLRNKCEIADANGKLPLSVPVIKPKEKTPYHGVRIDYRTAWQKQHWHALNAAYGSTPYFELLDFLFKPIFDKQHSSLVDFNLAMHAAICKVLSIDTPFVLSKSFVGVDEDLTPLIAKKAVIEPGPRYYQVFEDQRGFMDGTSILDLIFHCGPEGRLLL